MSVSSSLGPRSGFLNNPPRILLHEYHNATGSYPTIARTGDHDRSGKYNVSFNDTKTVFFGTGSGAEKSHIQYPVGLPAGHQFVNYYVASPNTPSDLEAQGCVKQGIQPSFIRQPSHDAAGGTLSAFDESHTYIALTEFYETGSKPDVLPEFCSKLRDKTQIVINAEPSIATALFVSTGTVAHTSPYASNDAGLAAGINSGIAYFNWGRKAWEVIGDLTSGSNVDYVNKQAIIRTGSYLAFQSTPQTVFGGSQKYEELYGSIGMPTSYAGFPFEAKFNATGSQLLDMSDYISDAFLLEKVVIEFSGSFNIAPMTNTKVSATRFPYETLQFFLLNQFESKINLSIVEGAEVPGLNSTNHMEQNFLPNPDEYIDHTAHYNVSKLKDLVAFARIGANQTAGHVVDNFDLDVSSSSTATGTFRIEKLVTTPSQYSQAIAPGNTRNVWLKAFTSGNPLAGRGMDGRFSGRSYVRSAVGSEISGSSFPIGTGNPTVQREITPYKTFELDSPYLLHPTDKLVFGAACQFGIDPQDTDYDVGYNPERAVSRRKFNLLPGAGKITFFGSLVKNQREYHNTVNQPLTSLAAHETLTNGPTLDQFDVEAVSLYSGSYIDETYIGSMVNGTRMRAGSVSNNTVGTTGSLLRGVKLSDDAERKSDDNLRTSSVYRYDTYGQYRDMIEQRKFTRFRSTNGSTRAPAFAKFVDRDGLKTTAKSTHSQNISVFMTSSIGYVEGTANNRTDNPDITLDTEVVI
jgi:hypothetical protein